MHWPKGFSARGELRTTPGHVIDLVPTVLDVAGGKATPVNDGPDFPGKSLVPALARDVRIDRDLLWWSHEGHRALRIGDWKLVAAKGDPWELFDLARDRAEANDLASEHPDRVKTMAAKWKAIEAGFRARLEPR